MSLVNCNEKLNVLSIQIIVDVVIWLSLASYALYGFLCGQPVVSGFFCDDRSLSYPYKNDTITSGILMSIGIIVPFCMVVITEMTKYSPAISEMSLQAVKGYAFFLFGFVVNQVFIDGIKQSVGSLRPNFLDVCKPNFAKLNCSRGYVTDYECTNTDTSLELLRESRTSFPSGHSAFSMFVAVYCVLYLQDRFQCKHSHLLRPILQCACVFFAILCGITRITDYKHHTTDVVAGYALGFVVATVVFRRVAAPVLNKFSGKKLGHMQTNRQTSQTPFVIEHCEK